MAGRVGNNAPLDLAAELPVSRLQVLRQDTGLTDSRHEVGVAAPARQNVHVDVICDPGTRRTSDIHTDIEAFGLVRFAQGLLASLHQIHHLVGCLFWRRTQPGDMLVRRYHQVSADIRIAIENNEIVLAAMNDKIAGIVGWILLANAEDAGRCGLFRTGGVDVFVPPGTPKYFHEEILRAHGD